MLGRALHCFTHQLGDCIIVCRNGPRFYQRGGNRASRAGSMPAQLLWRIDVLSRDEYQRRRVLYAYHEAGHAVVWHLVGGLVEEVSVASSQAGYQGYCRFGFLVPNLDDHQSPDEWLQRGRIDRRTVTAYYAGMLAMAYYCASYGGEDDYIEGGERDDLEKINKLLLRLSSDEQQRSTIRDACWTEAQQLLSDYWPAVQTLATKLLKRRTLSGSDVHRIIWQPSGILMLIGDSVL
jgi:hypothetical protein